MTCFLYIIGIIGSVLLARLVSVLDERKTRAVRNLCGKHEYYLLLCHFGRKVDYTLDILYRVAVAEAVAQTAILERSRSRPCEGDKAVVSVPYIDDIVEVLVGGVYLEIVELAVPVFFQYFKLLVAYTGLLISCDYLLRFRLGLLTEQIYEFLGLAGSECDVGLESAAGV